MKNNIKTLILSVLTVSAILCCFTACNDKETINDNSNNQISSGNTQKVDDNKTYNNGGLFVQYKGKTYYREYTNFDIEKESIEANYAYETGTKHSKYINAISSNGKVENIFEDDGYGNFYILDDRFYMSGYNNKIYSVDMKGKNYIEYCKGSYIGFDEKEHKIYYENINSGNAVYVINTQNSKITKLTEEEEKQVRTTMSSLVKEDRVYNITDNFSYSTFPDSRKLVITNDEINSLKEKYKINSDNENFIVKIRNIELVNNKIYYLIELSERKNDDQPYRRIASEVYSFDIDTGKKVLLYLYKITDEEIDQNSGDIYGSENIEEALAENEMYLEIKLDDKGLRETFDIRVEEVGGSIRGKRIEYEGVHSRKEGTLKIKVMKEIGAMLTVYIDGEMDSQMLIE